MDSLKNKLIIDSRDNAALKDLVATWKVGEKVTFTIEAQVDDIVSGGDAATLSIESIEPKGYENPNPDTANGEGDEQITPKADSPVMLALGAGLTQPA